MGGDTSAVKKNTIEIQWQIRANGNTKYGKRREGRWTPIRPKARDTRANPNSWETHLVRKRWDIGLLQALSLRIMMMNACKYVLMLVYVCMYAHKYLCMYA